MASARMALILLRLPRDVNKFDQPTTSRSLATAALISSNSYRTNGSCLAQGLSHNAIYAWWAAAYSFPSAWKSSMLGPPWSRPFKLIHALKMGKNLPFLTNRPSRRFRYELNEQNLWDGWQSLQRWMGSPSQTAPDIDSPKSLGYRSWLENSGLRSSFYRPSALEAQSVNQMIRRAEKPYIMLPEYLCMIHNRSERARSFHKYLP